MGIKYDRFQISDIDPIILVRKLVIKSDKNIMSKEQSVLLSMIDFYQLYMDINLLEDQLIDVQFEVFDSLTEQASLAFSSLLGKNISPETIKVSAIQYYNHFLERKLNFLKKGRGYLSTDPKDIGDPIISDYQRNQKYWFESLQCYVRVG